MTGAGEAPGKSRPERRQNVLLRGFITVVETEVRQMLARLLKLVGNQQQQELDNLCTEVLSELRSGLKQMGSEPTPHELAEFSRYTSGVTYRAYSEYVRWKYPRLHRLRTQLRYLFKSDDRLAIWQTGDTTWLCGLRGDAGTMQPTGRIPSPGELKKLLENLDPSLPGDLVVRLLEASSGSVELNDLVELVAPLWSFPDKAVNASGQPQPIDRPQQSAAASLEFAEWLARFWAETCTLPLPQRRALLLSLRDDRNASVLVLLPLSGIASVRQIANALELPETELASVWRQLPLDDAAIAGRFNSTLQQVINLRKLARSRLSRRMAV